MAAVHAEVSVARDLEQVPSEHLRESARIVERVVGVLIELRQQLSLEGMSHVLEHVGGAEQSSERFDRAAARR